MAAALRGHSARPSMAPAVACNFPSGYPLSMHRTDEHMTKPTPRRVLLATLAALIGTALLPAPPFPVLLHAQQAEPPGATEHDGAAALGLALRRLGTTKRVLMIAAHPDDENTALLAELALGAGADVAYLSLTRGEGGQNLIGPELQEGLGLIRSEELLAARRLDGARQFFTRAYDFGFSRSAAETLEQWPREVVLGDVVETIRRFRPDIVVSVFSGTPEDGHGHHQAAGILAREAFDAAGDASRFPGQLQRGLRTHRAHHLFQSMWRAPPSPPMTVATGTLDPLFGRSRHQVAMQSRSRHRSQDMGAAEPPGPQQVALRLLATSQPDPPASLFAGVDTMLTQHARSSGAPAAAAELLRQYEWIVANDLRGGFNPLHPERLVIPLADAMHLLRRAQQQLPRTDRTRALHAALDHELLKAGDALRLAAGVVVSAEASAALLVPGEEFEVRVTVWNGGAAPVGLQSLALDLPAGWTVHAGELRLPRVLRPGDVAHVTHRVRLPADADVTEAYFLRAPRQGALYSHDAGEPAGLPFGPAPVRVRLQMDAGTPFLVVRDAQFVEVDKALGQVSTPLRVVPAANVRVEPQVMAWPVGDAAPRGITVHVQSSAADGLEGAMHLDVPAGFRVDTASQPVRLSGRGDARALRFTVTPPANFTGRAEFTARFVAGAQEFRRGYSVIDYPHIHPHNLYRDATVSVSAFPVRIAENLRVGYIEGAGDDGAEALRQMGAHVEQLDAAALAAGDLSRFDAIVAGIRAYEVRRDLIAHNARLLEYVRNGGTFIVQYNKYEILDGGLMPYPATMARPHGRVTQEDAPVTLLQPEHPLLRGPNRITAADFDGWVQERGLYFLDSFDPRYTPLLAMGDPGEVVLDGGLVAARVGSGWYVYTGLALFRQLPEGVPGAYRLLANLVSLGRQR
jgi:LmbE family N-acetylglucosaminyl deacetylase